MIKVFWRYLLKKIKRAMNTGYFWELCPLTIWCSLLPSFQIPAGISLKAELRHLVGLEKFTNYLSQTELLRATFIAYRSDPSPAFTVGSTVTGILQPARRNHGKAQKSTWKFKNLFLKVVRNALRKQFFRGQRKE